MPNKPLPNVSAIEPLEPEEFHDEIFENLSPKQREKYRLVLDSITGKQYLTDRLHTDTSEAKGTFGERLADKVASFGGSWTFILYFAGFMVIWMGINGFLLNDKGFDPYPFILLNLCLSCLAAIQAPVIMMSQNRKEQRDRRRAEDDYLTNLKAEIEVRLLQKKLEQLLGSQRNLVKTTQKEEADTLRVLQASIESLKETVEGLCQHMKVPTK